MYWKVRFTQNHSVRKQLWTFNLLYMLYLNDVTEHDRRYELVELKWNCLIPLYQKCQFQFWDLEKFQFQFYPFWFNSHSELNWPQPWYLNRGKTVFYFLPDNSFGMTLDTSHTWHKVSYFMVKFKRSSNLSLTGGGQHGKDWSVSQGWTQDVQ